MNPVTPETTHFTSVPDAADAVQHIVIPALAGQAQAQLQRKHTRSVRVRKSVHRVTEPVPATDCREVVETTRVPVNQRGQGKQGVWNTGHLAGHSGVREAAGEATGAGQGNSYAPLARSF